MSEELSWLCVCGHYIETGLCCSRCGNEPPWGCECSACQSDEDIFDEEEIAEIP